MKKISKTHFPNLPLRRPAI